MIDRNSDGFKSSHFCWFTGVVEDRNDPEELNRVKVRCFGYHTEDKGVLPTESLPYASVMLPTTSSGTSGVGDTPHGLMNGSWVVGFFRDGPSAQDPVIMGTIASVSTPRDKGLGFTGEDYPTRDYENMSDVNFAAREDLYDVSHAFENRSDEEDSATGKPKVRKIETAIPAKVTTVAADKADTYYEEKPWNEIPPLGDESVGLHVPVYPYNKVNESECGHVTEVDCTPGYERTHRMHTSGTYEEIYADGTRSVKIVGDDYEVFFNNKNMHIRGNCNMTVDGDLRQLVYGNYHLEVEGDYTQNIKKSIQQKVGENIETEITGGRSTNITKDDSLTIMANATTNVTLDKLVTVGGNSTQTVTGNCGITSLANLNLFNSGKFSHTSLDNFAVTVDGTSITGITGAQTVTAASMDINGGSAIDMDATRIDLN